MSAINCLKQNLSNYNWQPFYPLSTKPDTDHVNDVSCDKTDSSTVDEKYKTEMCNNFVSLGYCKYETRCRFAHGKHELLSKKVNNCFYKQKNCETFFSKGYCPYGLRCTFRHDERTLLSILKPNENKLTELKIEFKKNYEKYGFEEADPNSKPIKERRLPIFNEITDEKISFNSKKIAMKIASKKSKEICKSIETQVI